MNHQHHSTGFCTSQVRSLFTDGDEWERLFRSCTWGVGHITAGSSWGMSIAVAAMIVIVLHFIHQKFIPILS